MSVEIAKPYMDPRAEELLSAVPTPRKALFLDRDGVINVDHGYVRTAGRTDFVDGIFDLVHAANRAGYLVVVVTNQAGIARGYYSIEDFLAYMRWMCDEFLRRDAHIDDVFFCPHHPTAGQGEYLKICDCRKPAPGMILDAAAKYGLDLVQSILVGDQPTDVEAGIAAGVGTNIQFGAEPYGSLHRITEFYF